MNSRWNTKGWLGVCAAVLAVMTQESLAQTTLTPLATFGGGDGWRAPGEVLAGDTAGTTTPDFVDGSPYYNYLNSPANPRPTPLNLNVNTERGFAYNPVTGNLVLVSRSSAGNAIRLLNGTTGVDVGSLNQGSGIISGGTFTTNMIGAGADGAIYVANLTAAGSPYNVYRWASEAAATPTVAYTGASPLAGARIGDTLDVIGSGVATRLVAGYGGSPAIAGNNSYSVFSTSDGVTYAGTHVAIGNPPTPGDFRLGITFAGSANDVWGKQTGTGFLIQQTTYSGAAGTQTGSAATTSLGEAPMDYATIGGVPYLASLDVNNSLVRIYDVSTPTAPVVVASATATSGTLDGNGNATGQVKFGAITGNTATVYALSTNQGIQAFTLTIPAGGADDADFDADGDVDGADFLTWQRGLGLTGSADLDDGDANNDNDVDADDLAIWKSQFGPGAAVGAVAAVPEPHACLLAGLAAAGLSILRRRRA